MQRHVDAFEQMSERMGYWADYENAYWTMRPDYVESVWWALKRSSTRACWSRTTGSAPYCTRCGTGLSDHELAQGYETVVDPSVYVRLPLTSGPYAGRAAMLVWTTTPWTLPSNALVAVKRRRDVRRPPTDGTETVVVASDLVRRVLGDGLDRAWTASPARTWSAGPTSARSTWCRWPGRGHFVVAEDYVTTDDGTGLVHQATVFGADDFDSVRRKGSSWSTRSTPGGRFELRGLALVGGMFFKDADEVLVADLHARGLLFRHVPYTHSYPHCWRCHTPLMYYALPSWYVRTTASRTRCSPRTKRPTGTRPRSSTAATATG